MTELSTIICTRTDGKFKTLEELQREHVCGVFKHYNSNITRTCKALGIGRTTLYRKLVQYGLRKKAS
jgi:transcriptional regulator of acetoin/glycerol metabolism